MVFKQLSSHLNNLHSFLKNRTNPSATGSEEQRGFQNQKEKTAGRDSDKQKKTFLNLYRQEFIVASEDFHFSFEGLINVSIYYKHLLHFSPFSIA